MDAFQRTLFPGGGDSVDDDACSVYTVEMVSAALGQHEPATPVPARAWLAVLKIFHASA